MFRELHDTSFSNTRKLGNVGIGDFEMVKCRNRIVAFALQTTNNAPNRFRFSMSVERQYISPTQRYYISTKTMAS